MAHVEREVLEKLYRGELPLDQQLEVLEHMSSCDYCATAFANFTEEMTLICAPSNLKSRIVKQAGELPIQFETKKHLLSKRLQLILYSMKIGVAAVIAIAMVFTVNMAAFQPEYPSTHSKTTNITSATDKFTQSINSITNQIMHGEVSYHD